MSLVNLPITPIELELGVFPRYYLIGDKPMTADEFNSKPLGSISGLPAICPEEVTQETPFFNSMRVVSVNMKNGVPYEKIEVQPRDEKSRQEFIEKFKFSLMSDLMRNGLPRIHYEGLISYVFRGDTYVFDIEDLCGLDLFRFPVTPNERRSDLITPHSVNMAANYLYIPCKVKGKLSVFHAQHKAATELLQKYFHAYNAYVGELNGLIKLIEDYQFNKQYTLDVLWENLYGTSNYYGQIERVVLK